MGLLWKSLRNSQFELQVGGCFMIAAILHVQA